MLLVHGPGPERNLNISWPLPLCTKCCHPYYSNWLGPGSLSSAPQVFQVVMAGRLGFNLAKSSSQPCVLFLAIITQIQR